ncbi:MAG TPA: divergent polysaccharide deacetylase family protein [Devosia sp.]|nr:divergent polysaccharide deacetylase family protein [Devosia sp.]
MADELSAPLGRKRRKAALPIKLQPDKLPLARLAFGLAGLVILGVAARIALVNDPNGGRPVAEVSVNSARGSNPVAESVGTQGAGSATITAGPEMPASGMAVSMVGDNVPDGAPNADMAPAPVANAQGLFPDLLEESEHGAIPRMSATGQTPFEAYSQPAAATPDTAGGKPLIAIIVTGLGLNAAGTNAAIQNLPAAVTLAFAPYGKGLSAEASTARATGHELLLEVPLEPFDYPESDPGPDTLLTGQAPRDNLSKLFTVMGKFGGYVGLINHMGARFTASTVDFGPVMEELGSRGLGYVDDGSSNRSVAPQLAAANAVAFGKADMMLDAQPARQPILDQLKALEELAQQKGSAIGVISALPVSLETLGEWARTAADRGITLVPVSALMKKSA